MFDKTKTLVPYFFLAVAIIVFFRLSGSLGVFGEALGWVWGAVSPFFYGFIIAYIINIPCGSVQKLLGRFNNKFIVKRQRALSVLIVILLFLGLITLALSFIIPVVASSIILFIDSLDDYIAGVMGVIDAINSLGFFTITEYDILEFFNNMFAGIDWSNLPQIVMDAILGIGNSVVAVVIAIISSIYILIEKDKLKASFARFIKIFTPETFATATTQTAARLNQYFRQYVRTQTLDGLILGTIVTIALTILGSPFALVLGITLGVLNYIPLFGSLIGTIVAIAIVMFTQDFTTGLIAAVVLIIIQQIDANIIQPRLMGSSFAFSPLLVIISITVGGAVAGVMGMIIAIPVAAIIKDIFGEIADYYEKKKTDAQK